MLWRVNLYSNVCLELLKIPTGDYEGLGYDDDMI